jgi:hypothetical protein
MELSVGITTPAPGETMSGSNDDVVTDARQRAALTAARAQEAAQLVAARERQRQQLDAEVRAASAAAAEEREATDTAVAGAAARVSALRAEVARRRALRAQLEVAAAQIPRREAELLLARGAAFVPRLAASARSDVAAEPDPPLDRVLALLLRPS